MHAILGMFAQNNYNISGKYSRRVILLLLFSQSNQRKKKSAHAQADSRYSYSHRLRMEHIVKFLHCPNISMSCKFWQEFRIFKKSIQRIQTKAWISISTLRFNAMKKKKSFIFSKSSFELAKRIKRQRIRILFTSSLILIA